MPWCTWYKIVKSNCTMINLTSGQTLGWLMSVRSGAHSAMGTMGRKETGVFYSIQNRSLRTYWSFFDQSQEPCGRCREHPVGHLRPHYHDRPQHWQVQHGSHFDQLHRNWLCSFYSRLCHRASFDAMGNNLYTNARRWCKGAKKSWYDLDNCFPRNTSVASTERALINAFRILANMADRSQDSNISLSKTFWTEPACSSVLYVYV